MENKIFADNKELIQNVTEEVLKRVLSLLQEKKIDIKKSGPKVMFLKPKDGYMENEAKALMEQISEGNAEIMTTCENINISCAECGHCKNAVDNCTDMVVYGLSNKELVNIALGTMVDHRELYIADAILKGKNIYVINDGIEYKKYKNTCNNNFYSMYESYEEKLKSYGIQVIHSSKLISYINKDNKVGPNINTSCVKESNKEVQCNGNINADIKDNDEYFDLTHKKLICEGELRKASCRGNKSVRIDKKAILTPLAMDFVRRNKMNLLQV